MDYVLDFNSKRDLTLFNLEKPTILFILLFIDSKSTVQKRLKKLALKGFEKIKNSSPRLIRQLEMMTPNVIHHHPWRSESHFKKLGF